MKYLYTFYITLFINISYKTTLDINFTNFLLIQNSTKYLNSNKKKKIPE